MANSDSKFNPLDEESRQITKYKECCRNHAMLIGGYAVDGCGEFIPKGDQGTTEAFICEACDCHRNFHRKQLIENGIVLHDTHHSPAPNSDPYTSVSDEESLVYNGSKSEKKMKARKGTKRGTSMHNKK